MTTKTYDDPWDKPFVDPKGATLEQIERFRQQRDEVVTRARALGLSKTEMQGRSGIPQGTFWQYLDGEYKGNWDNMLDRVANFLATLDEMNEAAARVPVGPGYINTPTSAKLTSALMYAQSMPSMVLAVLGSGMGKTMTAKEYLRRPVTFLVTMRPTTKSVQRMLQVIAQELEVAERGMGNLEDAIGKKLQRNGRKPLLIVDEAQNLTDEAVNQLRYFLDAYGTGIALLGNEELYSRFGNSTPKPAFAQLHRRIGMRLRQLSPTPGDIDAIVEAWGIEDPKVRQVAAALGRRPGALGQISETFKLAAVYAAGANRTITAEDFELAIENRGVREH